MTSEILTNFNPPYNTRSLALKGMLCHPYLSLQYYDLLTEPSVRGFLLGATNVLFKQRKYLIDVVVEVYINFNYLLTIDQIAIANQLRIDCQIAYCLSIAY